jgi:hypothetical protein
VPLLHRDDAADPGTGDDAAPVRVALREVETRIARGFVGRAQPHHAEAIHALRFARIDDAVRIEVFDLPRDPHGPVVALRERLDRPDAGAALDKRAPHRRDVAADVGHRSEAGDDDPSVPVNLHGETDTRPPSRATLTHEPAHEPICETM